MFDHLADGKWWDRDLQLVEGCTKVSPGCDHCWSLTAANMRRANPNPKIRARYEGTVDYHLDCPVEHEGPCRPAWTGQVNPQWQDLDKIGAARRPQVYTFWNDLFHPNIDKADCIDLPDRFINCVLAQILNNLNHFYIICTKRPERALDFFLRYPNVYPHGRFKNRLMLMTTVENQDQERRIIDLLQIPGVRHGVSYEPAMGPVDFTNINCPADMQPSWSLTGDAFQFDALSDNEDHCFQSEYHLDWLICGGETGPHARPAHPDWFRQARDQCQAAGVPFFLKSRGEFLTLPELPENSLTITQAMNANTIGGGFWRVGKKAAGRLLDGRTWDEVPRL